jgi:hypothetical protein
MFANNKYHAKKTVVDGITFDSLMEANRWIELRLLEKRGIIRELRRQVRFEIIRKTRKTRAHYYTADFTYIENNTLIVEDVKGILTRDYILRRDLLISSGVMGVNAMFREYTKKGIKDYEL